MSEQGTVLIENARLIFRNFAGKESQFNREGDRNFCVILDPDVAEQMANDGWNVKFLQAREEGDEPQPYIQVSVGYKSRPPKIVQITSMGRTDLGEREVESLDWVEILNVDLIFRPYDWTINGKSGKKAYLKSLFITIEEDVLDAKYRDLGDTHHND